VGGDGFEPPTPALLAQITLNPLPAETLVFACSTALFDVPWGVVTLRDIAVVWGTKTEQGKRGIVVKPLLMGEVPFRAERVCRPVGRSMTARRAMMRNVGK
jgi:hypothetical protein